MGWNKERTDGQLDSCANHQCEDLIRNLISGMAMLEQGLQQRRVARLLLGTTKQCAKDIDDRQLGDLKSDQYFFQKMGNPPCSQRYHRARP